MDPREYIQSLLPSGSSSLEVEGTNVVGPGAEATYSWLLLRYIKPLLAAQTVDELAEACARTRQGLLYQGPYSDVQLSLEPHKGHTPSAALPTPLISHVYLDAAKRFTLQTGTNVGNAEGYGYVKGTTRNYFGIGEVLSIDTHMGTRTKKSHLATCSFPGPVFGLPVDWKIEGLGYKSTKSADWALCKQEVHGLSLRASHMLHSCGVDGVLRTLYSDSNRTVESPTFVAQAGHAFKLSTFFNFKRDTRDDPFLPTRGSMLHVAGELATGDNPMAKLSLEWQRGFTLHPRVIASLSGRLGHIFSYRGTQSHVMDRFYMGGPLDVRGFKMYGGGPHEGPLSIGGDQVATAGASLFSPIAEKVYTHFFLNAGGLGFTSSEVLQPRVAAGVGIVYNHPISRFEMNIAMPLVAHPHDKLSKGLQFGVGMSYL